MRALVFVVVALALAACQKAFPIQLRSDLTRAELAPFAQLGPRHITGEAFLRQKSGAVVTCAGFDARLLPDVAVVREALKIWDAGDDIYTANLEYANVNGSVRWNTCDAEGRFVFTDLPALTYYVMVEVSWKTIGDVIDEEDRQQGGMLVRRVSLRHGSVDRLVLSMSDDNNLGAKPWELEPHLN